MTEDVRRLWPSILMVVAAVGLAGALFVLTTPGPGDDAGVEPATDLPLADPADTYNPVAAGEPLPEGYRRLLRRDDIDPVYQPQFVTADEVDWALETLVVGLALGDEARAYPVNYMNVHEMVNDRIADTPVLVSWCPLCGTATVHRRVVDGREVVFGNQGDLYGNAMTWWDHETGSVWSQPLGEAILGELEGTKVELIPSTLTQWGPWKRAHPETLAIDTFAFPMVVGLEDLAIVVDLGAETVAYPYPLVLEGGMVANDTVAGLEIAVVIDPTDQRRWAVFSRRLGDAVVELAVEGDKLLDVTTRTVFDPTGGAALDGPLEGETLDLLPGSTVFPDDFATFWPDGVLWGG